MLLNASLSQAQQSQTAPENEALVGAAAVVKCVALHNSGELDALQEAVHACQKDPLFLAQLGLQLNRKARFTDAAEHLERALLLDPNLKDVQLSYAIALTGLGELASAQALVNDLLQDTQLPASLRAQLTQQHQALVQAQADNATSSAMAVPPAQWQRRFSLGARMGYDSNLLGAPNLESLALTFSGQTLSLPLDESYLARGGAYTRGDAQFDLQRVFANGVRWNAVAGLRFRNSPALAAANSAELDLALERSQSAGLLGHYIAGTDSQLQTQSGASYKATGLGVGWAPVWYIGNATACQTRAGLEAQVRQYVQAPVLSGRYSGVALTTSCDLSGGTQWVLGLRHGRDQAQDHTRPGGDQAQSGLRATALLPLATTLVQGQLMLSFEYAEQQDASGYSPYIDNGAVRQLRRQVAKIEWQQPIGRASQWQLAMDWLAQSSSLALFQQQSWGASLGYKLGW